MAGFHSFTNTPVTSIRNFLDSNNTNSVRYRAASGTKDHMYIPYIMTEVINEDTGDKTSEKAIIAQAAKVHDWHSVDGKFKTCVCLKNHTQQDEHGNTLLDGTCPFCDNVAKAWDIVTYRTELEKQTCGKTGEELEKHLAAVSSDYKNELKITRWKSNLYLLVAVFRMKNDKEPVIDDNTKLPAFDLKVMKLSTNRVSKIDKAFENTGMEFIGGEMVIQYADSTDVRKVVSDSIIIPVYDNRMITKQYEGVEQAILDEAKKFNWDEIDSAYPEFGGMTTQAAREAMAEQFRDWDEFLLEREQNPSVKYLENKTSGKNEANVPVTENANLNVAGIGVPSPNDIFSGNNNTGNNGDLMNSIFGNTASAPKVQI